MKFIHRKKYCAKLTENVLFVVVSSSDGLNKAKETMTCDVCNNIIAVGAHLLGI
jgi:hypothetical protein